MKRSLERVAVTIGVVALTWRVAQHNLAQLGAFWLDWDPAKSYIDSDDAMGHREEFLLSLEEKLMQGLELHYRVVNVCDGDLGAPAAKKYDLEAWFPGQEQYRELTSCSNCTDFQARRLRCRFKEGEGGSAELVHTLNGTAVAIGRTLIAVMETHQQEDGAVRVPEAVRPFIPGAPEFLGR